MEEIVKRVEIEYGTCRDLAHLLSSRYIPSDSFYLSARHLSFRRKGKRNVEIVCMRVAEEPGSQTKTRAVALKLFRERKLKPGTLWEAAAILPRSLNICKSVKEYNAEEEIFWKEFGEYFCIFALGHQNPSFLGPQSAIIYSSRGRYGIKYCFQNDPIRNNIWYVGYRYLK